MLAKASYLDEAAADVHRSLAAEVAILEKGTVWRAGPVPYSRGIARCCRLTSGRVILFVRNFSIDLSPQCYGPSFGQQPDRLEKVIYEILWSHP
jgi:hypothetical protein